MFLYAERDTTRPPQPLILHKGLAFNFKSHLEKTQWKNLNSPSSSHFHSAINLFKAGAPWKRELHRLEVRDQPDVHPLFESEQLCCETVTKRSRLQRGIGSWSRILSACFCLPGPEEPEPRTTQAELILTAGPGLCRSTTAAAARRTFLLNHLTDSRMKGWIS